MEKTESLQSIELKKRARRRLMGATALVMAATIVLPMVLDKQPKPLEPDVMVKIPPLNTSTTLGANLDLPVKTTSLTQTQEKPASESASLGGSSVTSNQHGMSQPATPAVVNGMETISTDPAINPENPKEKTKHKQQSHKEEKKVDVHVEKPTANKEKPHAESATDHAHNSSDEKKYTIKLGTFTNETNAHKLKDKAGQLGISVYTESIKNNEGQTVTRVRAGPFTSKDEAQKIMSKLESAGIHGGVVSSK